jgi:response regulator NasT
METERPLRIVVADDEPDMRLFLREVLPRLGHQLVGEAGSGKELVECCRRTRPDLIVTDIRMPDGDGIVAAAQVNREVQVPVILVTAHHEDGVLEEGPANHIMAYLAKPVKPVDLQAAIRLAMLRFSHLLALSKEASDLRQALEDRKVIERAKGILMRRLGVDEAESYRRLRCLASSRNIKLVEVGREVLAAEEVLGQFDRM